MNHGTGRPWFAIFWFTFWGVFQGIAVASVINGTWERPAAFPAEAYESLIYPDMFPGFARLRRRRRCGCQKEPKVFSVSPSTCPTWLHCWETRNPFILHDLKQFWLR